MAIRNVKSSMVDMNELEPIVRQAQAGDLEAFRTLWERSWPGMRRLAGHLCANPCEADDLVQNCFVQCWKALSTLREPAAFMGWLRRILVNRARYLWRSRRPEESLDVLGALEPLDGEPNASEALDTSQRSELVRRVVASLPDGQREVIALFYLEELEVLEVASILGLPKGTVLSRLSRGRDALRERLSAYSLEVS